MNETVSVIKLVKFKELENLKQKETRKVMLLCTVTSMCVSKNRNEEIVYHCTIINVFRMFFFFFKKINV